MSQTPLTTLFTSKSLIKKLTELKFKLTKLKLRTFFFIGSLWGNQEIIELKNNNTSKLDVTLQCKILKWVWIRECFEVR
jgi:hypothetical protein